RRRRLDDANPLVDIHDASAWVSGQWSGVSGQRLVVSGRDRWSVFSGSKCKSWSVICNLELFNFKWTNRTCQLSSESSGSEVESPSAPMDRTHALRRD